MSEHPPLKKSSSRPWWSKADFICYLALLLGLCGVFPHAASAFVEILKALRGTASASELSQPDNGNGDRGERDPKGHAPISAPSEVHAPAN